jgi:hypothetical protein
MVGRVPILAAVDTAPLAIAGIASIVLGYGGIWALWHYVFSPRNEHDDDRDRERSARAERPPRDD